MRSPVIRLVALVLFGAACPTQPESKAAQPQPREVASEDGSPAADPTAEAREGPAAEPPPRAEKPPEKTGDDDPDPDEAAEPKAPCLALTDDIEAAEEQEVSSCKVLARAGAVTIVEVELIEDIADNCRAVFALTLDTGSYDFEEIATQREEPGHRLAYKLGKPKTTAKKIRLPVTSTESYFVTDGPKLGEVTEKDVSKQVLVCDLGEAICSLEDR